MVDKKPHVFEYTIIVKKAIKEVLSYYE